MRDLNGRVSEESQQRIESGALGPRIGSDLRPQEESQQRIESIPRSLIYRSKLRNAEES